MGNPVIILFVTDSSTGCPKFEGQIRIPKLFKILTYRLCGTSFDSLLKS